MWVADWLNVCEWGTREQKKKKQSESGKRRRVAWSGVLAWRSLCHWRVWPVAFFILYTLDNRALFANCTLHSTSERGMKRESEERESSKTMAGNCTCKCNSQIRKHIVIIFICIAKCVLWQWAYKVNYSYKCTHSHIHLRTLHSAQTLKQNS